MALVVGSFLLGACSNTPSSDETLSPLERRGRDLAVARGCESCHGNGGSGGVGPAWTGRAGTEVTLVDGTVVVADDDYLRRAIAQPQLEVVAGYTLRMPPNDLTADEIELIVAYLKGL